MGNSISLAHLGIGLAETISSRQLVLDDRNDLAATPNELRNLADALWRRIMTPLAFYPEFPEYGCRIHELRGMPFVPEIISMAEVYIAQSLAYEPRLESVPFVRAEPTDYRSLLIRASVKPASVPSVYMMTFDYFLE